MTMWTVSPKSLEVVRCQAADPATCRFHGHVDTATGEWKANRHYDASEEAAAAAERIARLRFGDESGSLRKKNKSARRPDVVRRREGKNLVSDKEYAALAADAEDVASTIAALKDQWPDMGATMGETSDQQAAMLASVLRDGDRFSHLRRWLGEDCDYLELSRCLLNPPIGLNMAQAWVLRPIPQPDGRYKVDLSGWRRAILTTVANDEDSRVPQGTPDREPASAAGKTAAAILFFRGKCAYCGKQLKRVYNNDPVDGDPGAASGDHIKPIAPKAGSRPSMSGQLPFGVTKYGNTVLCCARCNRDKANYRLSEYTDYAERHEAGDMVAKREEAIKRLNSFRYLTGGGSMPVEVASKLQDRLEILRAKSRELWACQEAQGGLDRADVIAFGRLMDLAVEEARLEMDLPKLKSTFVDEAVFDKADARAARKAGGRSSRAKTGLRGRRPQIAGNERGHGRSFS